jgi:hypothetical protein
MEGGIMANHGKLIATVIALALVPSAGWAAQWEKHGTKNGVTVFTAPVEDSDIRKIKAVTRIEGDTDSVYQRFGKVLAKVKSKGVSAQKLGSCGEDCQYVHQRISHPLIKDRSYVLKFHYTVTETDGLRTYRRVWKMTSDIPVPGPGGVLPDHVSGSWTFVPVDGGESTRLVLVTHMDLGSGVPAGIFNMVSVKKAYKALAQIRASY